MNEKDKQQVQRLNGACHPGNDSTMNQGEQWWRKSISWIALLFPIFLASIPSGSVRVDLRANILPHISYDQIRYVYSRCKCPPRGYPPQKPLVACIVPLVNCGGEDIRSQQCNVLPSLSCTWPGALSTRRSLSFLLKNASEQLENRRRRYEGSCPVSSNTEMN